MEAIHVNHSNLPEAVSIIYKELISAKKEIETFKTLVSDLSKKFENYSVAPKINEEADQLLTIQEAAEFCRVQPNAIYVWMRSGKIPYIKVGSKTLFNRSDLLNYNRVDVKRPKGLR